MWRIAPSSIKSLQILIAADSLVSFVFALKENPKIPIFLLLQTQIVFLLLMLRSFFDANDSI